MRKTWADEGGKKTARESETKRPGLKADYARQNVPILEVTLLSHKSRIESLIPVNPSIYGMPRLPPNDPG
jgi:hypothetical protein